MSFREQIQNIQDGIEDLDILMEAEQNARAALYEKYEKRGILRAAYHLWEDGHRQGDASDEEMTNDAIALGIDVTKEDWEQRLLDKLDEEYLGFYAIELEEVA